MDKALSTTVYKFIQSTSINFFKYILNQNCYFYVFQIINTHVHARMSLKNPKVCKLIWETFPQKCVGLSTRAQLLFLTFEYVTLLVCNKYIKAVNHMQPIYFTLFIFQPFFYHPLPLITFSKTSCRTVALKKNIQADKKTKELHCLQFLHIEIISSSFCTKGLT